MAEGNELGDWRSKCADVSERWVKAREMNYHTDVTFLVGQDAVSFSAHQIVLVLSSPVFKAMLFGSETQTKNPIVVTDTDPDIFEILIGFIYSSKANFSTVLQASKSYMAATTYRVGDLQAAAKDYVAKHELDEPQFWELINNKELMKIPMIKDKCLKCISKNADNVFQSYLFLNLSSDIVEEIVKMAEISEVTEASILSAMVHWSKANVPSGMTARSILQPLLKFIRFSNLTMDDFCSFLDCHPRLIDSNDALMIMKHLTKPEIYKLPQWCSTNQQQRT